MNWHPQIIIDAAAGTITGVSPTYYRVTNRNSGRVMTRGQLIDRIWGADYVGDTKTLDVHVKRIRGKIETDPANPQLLVTVRGLGYKFNG